MSDMHRAFDPERYSRQVQLPGIGESGQRLLLNAHALVIGAGGLGSPVLTYLAAAGVGHIGVVDGDTVALSNLNRQFLHDTVSVGQLKVDSAKRRLNALNPDVEITAYADTVNTRNIQELIASYDLVVDCVDNIATRNVVNAACLAQGKPLVEAGVAGFMGFVMTVVPGAGPCYRCLNPNLIQPQGKAPAILGATAGIAGALQASEAIKLILGLPDTLVGHVLYFDASTMAFEKIMLSKNPDCPLCSTR